MALVKDYKSILFRSMPENSGHLAIHITEQRCTIGVSSSSGALTFLRSLMRPENVYIHDFVKSIFDTYSNVFKLGYASVRVGVSTSNFTLIPKQDQVDSKEIIDFLTGSPTRATFTDSIDNLDAKFVYSIPQALVDVLDAYLTNYTLNSSLKLAIDQAPNLESNCILIFEDNYFDCIVIKNKNLHSVNRHKFNTPEAILYYVGLSLQDANIEPEAAKIIVTGTIKKHSPEFNLLYKFFQVIEMKPLNINVIVRSGFGSPRQEFQYVLNLLDANY